MCESLADELEQVWSQWQLEALSLNAAAAESGYSYSHLQALVQEGQLENVGRKGSPLVRRCDLPKKGSRIANDTSQDLAALKLGIRR